MTHQELAHLYETRINDIAPFITNQAASMSRMNVHEKEDLEQFARLHVWETLLNRPESTAPYLQVAAKNKMLEEQRRNKSVDRNSYRRKRPTKVFRLDEPNLSGQFTAGRSPRRQVDIPGRPGHQQGQPGAVPTFLDRRGGHLRITQSRR